MSFWSRTANVFRRDRLSREIDEELQRHIAEAIEQGREPAEARRAFGSVLRNREESLDVRLAAWLDSLRADAVFSWRQLMKRKVTSGAAILSLAPSPQRQFQPTIDGGQVRDGVIVAAEAVRSPVVVDDVVVQLMKTRQVREQMASEPGKRFGAAHAADRHFQVVTTPTPFDGTPRRRLACPRHRGQPTARRAGRTSCRRGGAGFASVCGRADRQLARDGAVIRVRDTGGGPERDAGQRRGVRRAGDQFCRAGDV